MSLKKKTKTAEKEDTSLLILRSLRRINRVVDMCSKEIKSQGNLTLPQILSLLAVHADGPMTVAQIASEVHLSSSTMVGIIDRLETKKLLKRERSVTDRREVYVHITDEGKKIAQKAPIPLQDKLVDALAKMSDSQEKALVKSLEQLVKMVDPAGIMSLTESACK
jgi:DNA-binding MarR family transcriptional regulator